MKLLLGTTNKGKRVEMASALAPLKPEIVTPDDLDITGSPPEDFETLEENALSKARFYFAASSGMPTLAEDAGLYVDALKDELGVKTRRWGAGSDATDQEWLAYFLKRMEREENRKAKFIAVAAYIDLDGNEYTFEGISPGMITREPSPPFLPGLPVSSCFQPDGYDRVFSQMSQEEKNRISHRGDAVGKFVTFIQKSV